MLNKIQQNATKERKGKKKKRKKNIKVDTYVSMLNAAHSTYVCVGYKTFFYFLFDLKFKNNGGTIFLKFCNPPYCRGELRGARQPADSVTHSIFNDKIKRVFGRARYAISKKRKGSIRAQVKNFGVAGFEEMTGREKYL